MWGQYLQLLHELLQVALGALLHDVEHLLADLLDLSSLRVIWVFVMRAPVSTNIWLQGDTVSGAQTGAGFHRVG